MQKKTQDVRVSMVQIMNCVTSTKENTEESARCVSF